MRLTERTRSLGHVQRMQKYGEVAVVDDSGGDSDEDDDNDDQWRIQDDDNDDQWRIQDVNRRGYKFN